MDAGIAVYRYGLKVQAFVFPRTMHTVRIIIDKHGNPWWVAKDVCEVLGIGNVSDAIARLDDDEFDTIEVTDSIGRKQKTYVVNESGLYSLLSDHDQPKAGGQGVQEVGDCGGPTVDPQNRFIRAQLPAAV
jgi:hypothetical protein